MSNTGKHTNRDNPIQRVNLTWTNGPVIQDDKKPVAIKAIQRSRIARQDKLLGKEVEILKKLKEPPGCIISQRAHVIRLYPHMRVCWCNDSPVNSTTTSLVCLIMTKTKKPFSSSWSTVTRATYPSTYRNRAPSQRIRDVVSHFESKVTNRHRALLH